MEPIIEIFVHKDSVGQSFPGVHYSLGCYCDIQDAVEARARAKELVVADAQGLLDFYSELEKSFPNLPSKHTEPKRDFPSTEWVVNNLPVSAARRSDNTSGYVGVYKRNKKWEARICYQGVRYNLGRFDSVEEAATARKEAEQAINIDPNRFVEEYSKKYTHHRI